MQGPCLQSENPVLSTGVEDPLSVCLELIAFEHGSLVATYEDYRLGSALQPIYSLAHQRPVGFEALVRARAADGRLLPPPQLFASARASERVIHLDRLCRTVHVGNFQALNLDGWLFLNINPDLAARTRRVAGFFPRLLQHFSVAPHQVVIEILENGIAEEAALEQACDYYRELGCLIALDDFGAGHSNFQRIWRCRPDIVKLDRQMIADATGSAVIRRSLPTLTGLLHEAGCLVLAEGVETEEQAVMVLDANIDLAQGYLFARPFPINDPQPVCTTVLKSIHRRFIADDRAVESRHHEDLSPYSSALERLAEALRAGADMGSSAVSLLRMERTMRLFLLNDRGDQTTQYFQTDKAQNARDPRLQPLTSNPGSVWYHRPYFRRALANPGTVQVTRPYLSLPDARMCQTLSLCLEPAGEHCVLCLDICAQAR